MSELFFGVWFIIGLGVIAWWIPSFLYWIDEYVIQAIYEWWVRRVVGR